jgi:hypothetical protein
MVDGLEESAVERQEVFARARLLEYLTELGIADSSRAGEFVDDLIAASRKKISIRATDELLRHALEEALKRFDKEVGRVFDLPVGDRRLISSARAAAILDRDFRLDPVVFSSEGDAAVVQELRDTGAASLPLATPPESALTMEEQHISFMFSR